MSTKMQRLFSLMMAVLMMLSLTACGGNATSSTPASVSGSGSESGEQVSEAAKRLEEQKELNIMFVAGNFAESMQKIYADYEKEYGVKINYTILGVDTYFQKMLVEMSSESDAYDLIYLMSPQFLQYASNDWLATPGIASTAILSFIFSWNEFLFALLLTRQKVQTAPIGVLNFIVFEKMNWGVIAAGAIVIALPVIFFGIAIRKYYVKGLTQGGLAGD